MKPRLLLLTACALFPGWALAQSITLTNNQVIAAKAVRRAGAVVMATVDLAGGTNVGEVGYQLTQIARIDFPEPAPLASASADLDRGDAARALAEIEPIVRYYEPLRDVTGNYWAQAAILKIRALVSLGRAQEASLIASQFPSSKADPDQMQTAKVYAASMGKDRAAALAIYDDALKSSRDDETVATAAFFKGQNQLAQEQFETALLAFLQIPVFYPQEVSLMPSAWLGAARAYVGIGDPTKAREAYLEVTKSYPGTPQAAQAKAELAKLPKTPQ